MFIVSKDRKSLINAEQVTCIYASTDGCSLKVDFQNGRGCQIGKYNSDGEARIAIGIIADSIKLGNMEVCFMPDDNAIKAKLNLDEQKYHHITGKKTKGHGGS